MRAGNDKLNIARAVGSSGADYLNAGTLAYATQWPINKSTGWYAFVVAEAATITAVTFKDKSGVAHTPVNTTTWLNVSLPAGSYIPAGFVDGEDVYISSITTSSCVIILYLD